MFEERRIRRNNGYVDTFCASDLYGHDLAMSPIVSPEGTLSEAIFEGKYIRMRAGTVLPGKIVAGFEAARDKKIVDLYFGPEFGELEPEAKIAVHSSLVSRLMDGPDRVISLNLDAESWDDELRQAMVAQIEGITIKEYKNLIGARA